MNNDAIALRLALIQSLCPVETETLAPVVADCESRAAGVTAFAERHFSVLLLPATAWVSPLHAPAAALLKPEA